MKSDLTLPEEKELKAVPYPKGEENKFERLMQDMTRAIVQQYRNETFNKLNKGTVDKFEDAQVGNWASVFIALSKGAKKKIRRRFNNKRIAEKVTQILSGLDRSNQSTIYKTIEETMGISSSSLIAKEGLKPSNNALIQESIEWVQRNMDETLADMSANSLRLMAGGEDVEEVVKQFNELGRKRVESSKFVARNQIANFNSFNNKIRYQNLGITEAIWVTARDERVRPAPGKKSPTNHRVREGKRFTLSEGLFSSVDGKTLMPGQDFNCRCIMKPIIPGDEDE